MNLFRCFMTAGVLSGWLLAACSSPTAKPAVGERATGSATGSTAVITARPTARPTAPPTAPQTQPPAVAATTAVVIAVASITLADDCPPDAKTATMEVDPKAKQKADRDDSATSRKSRAKREDAACVQTAIQLDLRSSASAATTIALRKAELIDSSGKVLGELTPRSPVRWTDAGTYVAWDQSLAAGATLNVSWALSSPTWAAYGTTKAAAAAQVFQVRITVAVNGADQTVAGQTTVMSPPAIHEAPMKT